MESCSISCAWTTYRTILPNNFSATHLYKDKKTLSQMPLKLLQSKTKKKKNPQIKADPIQHNHYFLKIIVNSMYMYVGVFAWGYVY